ncbi:unnamed protein product [Bathycoccus prasinos]
MAHLHVSSRPPGATMISFSSSSSKKVVFKCHHLGKRRTRGRERSSSIRRLVFPNTFCCKAFSNDDDAWVERACVLADQSAGECAPHPKFACVIVHSKTRDIACEAFQFGQAGEKCERQAERKLREVLSSSSSLAKKETTETGEYDVYLNMEPVHGVEVSGETRSVDALTRMRSRGVRRIVIGTLHPNEKFRGNAIKELVERGGFKKEQIVVCRTNTRGAMCARKVNEALLYRCATGGYPHGVYKYAMTLDGKIASSSGKSKWVTGPESRETSEVRCGDCRWWDVADGRSEVDQSEWGRTLTHAYQPARVVLSRSFDVPEDARLWDTSVASTIVMTSAIHGKPALAKILRDKGVDVVEFEGEFTMDKVLDEMRQRGWLQTFWECGGTLAAPAITAGAFSRVLAFVAPKIVGGGSKAPTPMGDFGCDAMADAVPLKATDAKVYGRDVLITGYLPNAFAKGRLKRFVEGGWMDGKRDGFVDVGESSDDSERVDTFGENEVLADVEQCCADEAESDDNEKDDNTSDEIRFYKSWDTYSALSNFSAHAVDIDGENWLTSESYYQAQKFDDSHPDGVKIKNAILKANSPEKASRIGRSKQRERPDLVKKDWNSIKIHVMDRVLRAKFTQHRSAQSLLLSTGQKRLVEDSPVDNVWGSGRKNDGKNLLGVALMKLRDELRTSIVKDYLVDELERLDDEDLANVEPPK